MFVAKWQYRRTIYACVEQMTIIGMTVESEGSVSGHQEAMVILFYCFDKISHNSDRLKVESIILQSILDY